MTTQNNPFMKFKQTFIALWIGNRVLNKTLDEIKPNRLNSTWYGLPYIGRSYNDNTK